VVTVTPTWLGAIAGLLAALAGILMSLVLTGAITRAVAAEVAGEDPSVEQSYRVGFHRLDSVLLVSVLVGLATIGGLILVTAGLFLANAIRSRDLDMSSFGPVFVLFIIPGIYPRGAVGGQYPGAGGGGPTRDRGHGSFLGAGRRALVACFWHPAGGVLADRDRQCRDHRAVQSGQGLLAPS
jgi:hypothetical protein